MLDILLTLEVTELQEGVKLEDLNDAIIREINEVILKNEVLQPLLKGKVVGHEIKEITPAEEDEKVLEKKEAC